MAPRWSHVPSHEQLCSQPCAHKHVVIMHYTDGTNTKVNARKFSHVTTEEGWTCAMICTIQIQTMCQKTNLLRLVLLVRSFSSLWLSPCVAIIVYLPIPQRVLLAVTLYAASFRCSVERCRLVFSFILCTSSNIPGRFFFIDYTFSATPCSPFFVKCTGIGRKYCALGVVLYI